MPILKLTGILQDDFTSNDQINETKDFIDSVANSGQKDVVVGDGSKFSVGEMVIIYDGYEMFENAVIESINGNILTMTENLSNSYPEGSYIGKFLGVLDTVNNQYLRLQSPDLGDGGDGAFESTGNETWSSEKNFTSVLIKDGHTITVNGNFPIKCQGTFEIEAGGKISAKAKGHAGGYGARYYGNCGASELGGSTQQWERNGGGGGGGYASGSSISRSCGAGGGYGTNGGNGYTYGSSPNNTPQGGLAYNDSELSNFSESYLKGSGGGGGAGAESSGHSRGGYGGGIIRIHCKNLIVNGEIDCDGGDATEAGTPYNYYTGGGGGGAGGTIYLQVLNKATLGTNLVHSNGGIRSGGKNTSGDIWGYGGNGGKGRIRIEAGKIDGSTSPTLVSGFITNLGGYAKYGWYFTKEIKALNETITVNGYFKQEVTIKINLSAIANLGQADVDLIDASDFEVGDKAILLEDEKMEIVEIQSISTNKLTMTEDLKNTYYTGAQLLRIDAYGLISLEPVDDDENLQDMMLQSVEDLGDNIWYLSYSKTVKAMNNQDAGVRLIGCVKLKGRSNNTNEIKLKEINWNYF
ncbi:MAG: hypothetical protein K9M44_00145 [Candidatus Pacebacteria bacterium]|nr:hypothetical protein [Candidatus Paceibacterota bacterium]